MSDSGTINRKDGSAPIEVAAGLVFRQGRLLITQRPACSHLGGLWEFPGGKREAGESLADCLRRELREELGIEVDVGELVESAPQIPEEGGPATVLPLLASMSRAGGCAAFR
jgi:8-oxo-dGTP pyrophosphatase MutT (NUDIX family)